MGNQHSGSGGEGIRPFSRGSLGLSRTELDNRCQASGLYDACAWDDRTIRKLVGDGKLAARTKGGDSRSIEGDRECPICFLYYNQINLTKCCSAHICTECYLQVRPQKEKHSSCPFCNHHKLSVTVAKKLTSEQAQDQWKEEQRVMDAQMRAAKQQNDSPKDTETKKASVNAETTPTDGFGSSLKKDSRVALMRARSESVASSSEGNPSAADADTSAIQSIAMTPEERRRLEDEMKAQVCHPLTQQIEAEAAERRLENDRAYSQTHGSRSRRNRRSRNRGGGRDWNNIVDAFERGGHGEVQSLDDIVVLEAAIVLSMEEENRRTAAGANSNNRSGGADFDPSRHAQDGFPLVRSFLSNRGRNGGEPSREDMQLLARSLRSSRRRNQLLRARNGISTPMSESSSNNTGNTTLDTASMLMRGISEEEQMAMAIAASLQEQPSSATAEDTATEEAATTEDTGDNDTSSAPITSLIAGLNLEEVDEDEVDSEDDEEPTNGETSPRDDPAPVTETGGAGDSVNSNDNNSNAEEEAQPVSSNEAPNNLENECMPGELIDSIAVEATSSDENDTAPVTPSSETPPSPGRSQGDFTNM